MAVLTWPDPGDALDGFVLADSTAAAASTSVPGTYPVAIDGHPYKLELDSYGTGIRGVAYRRTTLDVFRTAQDGSATPGEQSLSTEGYWLRSQRSWLYGSGQLLFDSIDDGVDNLIRRQRWLDSWNCEPDTDEGVKMLRSAANSYAQGGFATYAKGNLAVQAGQDTYFLAGTSVIRVRPGTGATVCTGVANPEAIASDGYNIWVLNRNTTVLVTWYQTVAGSTAFSAMSSGAHAVPQSSTGVALYANGFLLVTFNGGIYSVDNTGVQTLIDTVAVVASSVLTKCVAACASTNFWYFAFTTDTGADRYPTTVFKLSVDTSGVFTKASVALPELSSSEFVQAMIGIGSDVMLIGTNGGFRAASIDSSGNISVGALNQLATAVSNSYTGVTSFAKVGSKVAAAFWDDRFTTNVDTSLRTGSQQGLIMIDVSRFVTTLQPSWWFWWRNATTPSGTAVYVGANLSAPVVLVDQTFYSLGTTNLITPCSLVTSWISYGMDASKSYIDMEVFHDALATGDTVSVYYQTEDSTTWNLIGTSQQVGTVSNPDPFLINASSRRLRFCFVMVAGSSAQSTTPRIRRWQLRAFPAPRLTDEIMLPIVLFDSVLVGDEEASAAAVSTRAEYDHLVSIAQSGRIVLFQEGGNTENVKVSKLELQPAKYTTGPDGAYSFYQGWCIVRLLSL